MPSSISRLLKIAGALVFTAMVAGVTSAQASVVRFDFASTCCGFGSNIPGTSAGMAVDISIFADNGGNSTLSQSWSGADYLSATANIGGSTYSMTLDSALDGGFNATTDALGNVTALYLADFSGNSDSLGNSGAGLIVNGFHNVIFTGGQFAADVDLPTTPENWRASLVSTQVPEPGTAAMLGLALLALGYSRRKRG
jgi:PEP-CTERM motif